MTRLFCFVAALLATSTLWAQEGGTTDERKAWATVDLGASSEESSSASIECPPKGLRCPVVHIHTSTVRHTVSSGLAFVHQRVIGDFDISAAVQEVGLDAGIAGLSVRSSLADDAAELVFFTTADGALRLALRREDGGPRFEKVAASALPAAWLKLERRGHAITVLQSADGGQWAMLASVTLHLADSAYVGLVAAVDQPGTSATAVLSDLRLVQLATLPDGWTEANIGSAAGTSARFVNDVFELGAQDGGVSGYSDRFIFVHTRVSGDVEMVARLTPNPQSPTFETGLMFRESLAHGSALHFHALTPGGTTVFKRRAATGLALVADESLGATGATWLKLVKRGPTVTAFTSLDGTAWTAAGTDTTAIDEPFYVGLATAVGQTLFQAVSVRELAASQPPLVTLDDPAQHQVLLAGVPVELGATATAAAANPDDQVVRVEFYVDEQRIGVDSAPPYRATWNSPLAGEHVVRAVATAPDGGRASTSSHVVTVATPADASLPTDVPTATDLQTPTAVPIWPPSDPAKLVGTPSPVTYAIKYPTSTTGLSPSPLTSVPAVVEQPWRLVFSPSPDHGASVDRYLIEVRSLVDRALVFAQDLGRPVVVNGECSVDVTHSFAGLPGGLYEVIVTAVDDAAHLSSPGAAANFVR